MDEDQQRDVGRQLVGLRVWVVDRPDLGVGRCRRGVRRVGGVLAKQAWVGRLGWSMLVSWSKIVGGIERVSNHHVGSRIAYLRRARVQTRQCLLLLC